ncbi:MAG: hypothetical protein AB1595_01800 [bacterium]
MNMSFKKKRGVALFLAIIFSILFVVMAITIAVITISNVKTTTELKKGLKTFYGAEAGIFAVAGWIIHNQNRFDIPLDILEPCLGEDKPGMGGYRIKRWNVVGGTIHPARGFSSHWWALDVFIDSEAPPNNPTAEIEAIVAIPFLKKSYGNE